MPPRFFAPLVPRKERSENGRPILQVLRSLSWVQWGHLVAGYLAWLADSLDFFTVSLSITWLQTQFKRDISDITTAITLTLLLRPVGAVVFGILSDRFGRRWSSAANLLLIAVLELGSSFVQTFHQFLAVRSLLGVAVGGIWGMAYSSTLENLPLELRGFASGVLHQAYPVGNSLAIVISLFLVPEVESTWRSLFWVASGISLFAAVFRALLPETDLFLRVKALQRAQGVSARQRTVIFCREAKEMLTRHWLSCLYATVLISGLSFLSHGSQDLYPAYLVINKGFDIGHAIAATIIGNCGATTGSGLAGFASQYIGRRLTMLILVLSIGFFIPVWILPTSFTSLATGAFFIQFCVQGVLGVIPIHLAELSPPAFRATFSGLVYQLGAMISSASTKIETTGGDNLKTVLPGTTLRVPDYATVQGIVVGTVAAFVGIIVIAGPENHGFQFEKYKVAFEEGGGRDEEHSFDDISDPEKLGDMPPRLPSLNIIRTSREVTSVEC